MPRKVILNITPQTHVRATQGDSIFFRIPREKLRPAGLSRLMRLEKYNQVFLSGYFIYFIQASCKIQTSILMQYNSKKIGNDNRDKK